MKKLVALIVFCLLIVSCTAKPTEKNITIISQDTISFTFETVEDVVYSPATGEYYIEYNNSDQFDYENLAYKSGMSEWYGFYISIPIEEYDVKMFLKDWERYIKSESYIDSVELDEHWDIIEIWYLDSNNKQKVKFEIINQN